VHNFLSHKLFLNAEGFSFEFCVLGSVISILSDR
jgi:hypothetical protein